MSEKKIKKSGAKTRKPSKKAKASAARLYAVQGVYQMIANEQSCRSVLEEILYKRVYEAIDDQELVKPDGALLTSIVEGVDERRTDLSGAVMKSYQNTTRQQKNSEEQKIENSAASESVTPRYERQPEGIVFSVLLCGAYELLAHHEIDAPIIISEYINVGHAYFDRGETRLINGVLDNLAKTLR